MNTVSEKIRELIAVAKPRLLEISPEIVCQKIDRDTWSKQEILGHLIDSTLNNHQRFVRGAQNVAGDFPTYNQDRWVQTQCHNERKWVDLVDLWVQCCFHLSWVIDCLPEGAFNNPCNIGKENPVPLRFIIEDYLRHLKHHIEKILELLVV